MSLPRRWHHTVAALAVTLLLASCDGLVFPAQFTLGDQVISIGTVTGFGSVFVNGVEYAVDDTTEIIISGNTFDGSDERALLGLGMVVRVEGRVNPDRETGSANRIVFDSSLRGPVGVVDLADDRFTLLGIEVNVLATAQFVGNNGVNVVTDLASLQTGDNVEVSGFRGSNGDFFATRVVASGDWPLGGVVAVEDIIATVSGNTLTLESGLEVDLSATAPDFAPAVGQRVEVAGTYDGTRLNATEAELFDGLIDGEDGTRAELEGVITSSLGNLLQVNGYTVRTTTATVVNGGLQVGRRVEAEGVLEDGVLVAESVIRQSVTAFLLQGEVLFVNPVAGTFELFGQEIAVTAETIIENKASFFDDLQEGDRVVVLAATGADNLIATEAAVTLSATDRITGPVAEIAGFFLEVGDILIDVTAVPDVLVGLEVGDQVDLVGSWDSVLRVFTATAEVGGA